MGSNGLSAYGAVMHQRVTFQQPIARRPTMPSRDRRITNFFVIGEEWAELVEGMFGQVSGAFAHGVIEGMGRAYREAGADPSQGPPDLVATADAMGDLVITIYGLAIEMGIDLDLVIAEQMRANMTKLDDEGRPVFNEDGKYTKTDNYSPPQVAEILRELGWDGEETTR